MWETSSLLGRRGIFGYRFGAFWNSMFCELTGQDQPNTDPLALKTTISKKDWRGLDFARWDSWLFVVCCELRCLGRNPLKNICSYVSEFSNALDGSRLPLTKELRIDMARFEIPVSGWTCFKTEKSWLVTYVEKHYMLGIARKHFHDPKWKMYLCRCMTSRFLFGSYFASSSHRSEEPSSCQPPFFQLVLFLLGLCLLWRVSFRQLWEAFRLWWKWLCEKKDVGSWARMA